MFLKNTLPDDYHIFYDIRINNSKPDFVIVAPNLGIIVLEVKAWSLNFIESSNVMDFTLVNGKIEKNPLEQAEEYRQSAVEYVLDKEIKLLQTEGRYVNKLKFPRASGVVFTSIKKYDFLNSPHRNSIDSKFILFEDDIVNVNDKSILIEKLENMFISRRSFIFNSLTQDDIKLIKEILYKPSANSHKDIDPYKDNSDTDNHLCKPTPIKTSNFYKIILLIYKLIKAYFILVAIVSIIIGILFVSYLRENNINLYEIYLEEKNSTNNRISEEANMIFSVGTNHVGKGTFILIKDGKNYLASKVFMEGSIISFYKDKKITISESDSNLQEFSVNSDIIELEVGNAYTKIYLNNEEYKFTKNFKYDFINGVIIRYSDDLTNTD